ncbi:CDP-diacylglycerol--serine O-phosphatidyltransferase [Tenuifilaceae bacterium CYCD]|nr:CDP-diacylglycerol--serine O-phosphatidyltransferase [Tenuifilaceae bacterium CYCD]
MPSPKNIIKHFPNAITLLNLVAGCFSIVASFEGQLELAGLFILIAGVFDFLDGFTARLIKAYTLLGKELDSLSDVVSFGVAPSMILFQLMKQSMGISQSEGMFNGHWMLAIPFVMAAFSSLRLGIFNIDERQTSSFIGLPTPANAFLIAGLVFGLDSNWSELYRIISTSSILIVVIVVIQSFLLVCELPMFSLKIKSLSPKIAYKQFILIGGAIALFIIFHKASLSLIILWYILLSIIFYIADKMFKND